MNPIQSDLLRAMVLRLDADATAVFDWLLPTLAPAERSSLAAAIVADDSLDAFWSACDARLDEPRRLALDCACVFPAGHAHAGWLIDLLRQATALPPRASIGRAAGPEADAIDALLDNGLLRPVDEHAERVSLGESHRRWRDARLEASSARMKTVGNAVQRYLRERAWPTAKNRARAFAPRELPSLVEAVAMLAAKGAPLTASSIANGISWPLRKRGDFAVAEAMHRPLLNPPLLRDDADAKLTHRVGLEFWSCALRRLERFADAEQALVRAIAIARRLEPDSLKLAELIDGHAILASDQKRYEEAESLAWQAQAIRRQTVGEQDKACWMHHATLAGIFHRSGRHARAAEQASRALAISQASGASPERVAADASMLAICRRLAGEIEASLIAGDEAIERSLDHLRDDDPQVATRYVLQAKTMLRAKRFDAARDLFLQALAIYDSHGETASSRRAVLDNDLAVAYLGLGELDAALRHADNALSTHFSLPEPRPAGVIASLFNRTAICLRLGNDEAARASFHETARWFLLVPADAPQRIALTLRRRFYERKLDGPSSAVALPSRVNEA